MTERQEHIFNWVAVIVVLLYVTAWIGALVETWRQRHEHPFGAPAATAAGPAPPTPSERVTDAVLGPGAPKAAYLSDAMLGFLHPLRGESGDVQFAPALPGSTVVKNAPVPADAVIGGEPSPDFVAPADPGIYKFAVQMNQATRAFDDLSIVTLVPLSRKHGGRIGPYYLGSWPWENGGTPRSPRYAPPTGFIEVTPANQDFHVSRHFQLRDFLTKGQGNVWPKYLLLDPKLLDKLELTIQELEARGIAVEHLQVMSGFRTPAYNYTGGNTEGRANLSRHMYGDASDVFVDNNRDGYTDDINHDGRVDVRDAEVVGQAAETVERKHGGLIGGIGVYSACCGHGPFTHIDVRGYRARWRGSGSG